MKTYQLNLNEEELCRLLQTLPQNEHSFILSKLTSEQRRELVADSMSNPIIKNNKLLQYSKALSPRHVKLHPS